MKRGAILVPFRDRAEHLKEFIPHYRKLTPELEIIICEQFDSKPFNRAKLFNCGFLEEGFKYDFAVYSDVDMLAEEAIGYEFFDSPVHLASAASQFEYKLPYDTYYGGVTNIPKSVMHAVNGFSNNFWGHSGEDDHMYNRLIANEIPPYRIDGLRYKSLPHVRHIDQKLRANNIKILNAPNDPTDGLSSCVYELVSKEQKDGYLLIRAIL